MDSHVGLNCSCPTAIHEFLRRHNRFRLACLGRAFYGTEITLTAVLRKARLWEKHKLDAMNERQRQVLNKMLDGFEGNLTTVKWAKIAKCPHDRALRDIQDLIDRHILIKDPAGGRSTSYSLQETNE